MINERELFEAYQTKIGMATYLHYLKDKNEYGYPRMQADWKLWQARANLIPDGYKLVPIEPTDAMINAAMDRYKHGSNSLALKFKNLHFENYRHDYKSMISASTVSVPNTSTETNDQ